MPTTYPLQNSDSGSTPVHVIGTLECLDFVCLPTSATSYTHLLGTPNCSASISAVRIHSPLPLRPFRCFPRNTPVSANKPPAGHSCPLPQCPGWLPIQCPVYRTPTTTPDPLSSLPDASVILRSSRVVRLRRIGTCSSTTCKHIGNSNPVRSALRRV